MAQPSQQSGGAGQAARPVIQATGLRFSGRRSRDTGEPILNGLDLTAYAGETLLLDGPSGCGKSTLLWALARMLPAEGHILLNGRGPLAVPAQEWRLHACLLLQKPVLTANSVRDNLLLPFTLAAARKLAFTAPEPEMLLEELAFVGLGGIGLERPARDLSVGEAARVAFVRGLVTCPDCLLLDEPTASLDKQAADQVLERLSRYVESGGCAIVVRHGDIPLRNARSLSMDGGRLREHT